MVQYDTASLPRLDNDPGDVDALIFSDEEYYISDR